MKVPLYHQVTKYLTDKINSEYQPGDIIPTQGEIASLTNTSLITVKRAISELVAEGYLETIAGKGTFVKKPQIVDTHVGVSSWTSSIESLGKKPGTTWKEVEKRIPSDEVANYLKLKSRDKTLFINRLRSINNEPACLMTNEIALSRIGPFVGYSFDSESFYNWLQDKYGLVAVKSEEEVYARMATEEEEKYLNTNVVLVIERLSYLKHDEPFEFSRVVAAANSYRYRTTQVNKNLAPEKITSIIKHDIK